MKKTISIFMLAALLIGGLTGCYEDKGNYKYRDINEVTIRYCLKVRTAITGSSSHLWIRCM